MGILADALSILLGGFFGSKIKNQKLNSTFTILAIGIMLISLVGFFENTFSISEMKLQSTDFLVVVFSLILGNYLGEAIKLDEKLSNCSNSNNSTYNAFVDTMLFFSVGGLQISGPILLAVNGDSSQLILKSLIDFPFALMFGMTYGKITSLAFAPVAVIQVIISLLSFVCREFFCDAVTRQLCALGYVVLFFSGFNLIIDSKFKIKNINMIPGIFFIVIYNAVVFIWGWIV